MEEADKEARWSHSDAVKADRDAGNPFPAAEREIRPKSLNDGGGGGSCGIEARI